MAGSKFFLEMAALEADSQFFLEMVAQADRSNALLHNADCAARPVQGESPPKRCSAKNYARYRETWYERLKQLKKYVARNGRQPLERDRDDDGWAIGAWCARQRQIVGSLPGVRVKALGSVEGWHWVVGQTWRENMKRLKTFVARKGRLPGDGEQDDDGWAIGDWCASRQREYTGGKMSAACIQELSEIPGWVWIDI